MKEIFPTVAPFDKLLDKRLCISDLHGEYRPNTYCIEEHIPEGVLLYNNMTKAMVLLSETEMDGAVKGIDPLPELVGRGFFVSRDNDDKLMCKQMRDIARTLKPQPRHITGYTIFTTTDCNARCFYCFEKGTGKIRMSPDTARKAAEFIAGHCGGKEVGLSWFGGEPLYNREAIDIICSLLKDKGIAYRSKMISNGFLFNREAIQSARELWKLEKVQITLDGTRDIYNKVKAYIYKNIDAFSVVIQNIHDLLDNGIRVSIRLNIDAYNAEDLIKLSSYLAEEFSKDSKLSIYAHPLFGDTCHFAVQDSDKREYIYKKIEQIQSIIAKYAANKQNILNRLIKTNQCMADDSSSLTILPSGKLGKCEHYTDKYFVGDLNGNLEIDQKEIEAFKEEYPEMEECNTCPLFPDCIRLVRCNGNKVCYQENREDRLRQLRSRMRAAFYKANNC